MKQQSSNTVQRIANSIDVCESIIDNVDNNIGVKNHLGSHTSKR